MSETNNPPVEVCSETLTEQNIDEGKVVDALKCLAVTQTFAKELKQTFINAHIKSGLYCDVVIDALDLLEIKLDDRILEMDRVV